MRKRWIKLWWAMAEGDTAAYERLKKLDMIEFYEVFDMWTEENKKKQENIKNQKHGRKQ